MKKIKCPAKIDRRTKAWNYYVRYKGVKYMLHSLTETTLREVGFLDKEVAEGWFKYATYFVEPITSKAGIIFILPLSKTFLYAVEYDAGGSI